MTYQILWLTIIVGAGFTYVGYELFVIANLLKEIRDRLNADDEYDEEEIDG